MSRCLPQQPKDEAISATIITLEVITFKDVLTSHPQQVIAFISPDLVVAYYAPEKPASLAMESFPGPP